MKQEFEGENPLCQLNIGAKKMCEPKTLSIQNAHNPHLFTRCSAVCNILSNWKMMQLLLFAFYCVF